MIYLKGILSGLAAFFIAQVVCFWPTLGGTSKAIGLAALAAQSVENILSVLFWVVGALLFWAFFTASRARTTHWRVGLFWVPTLMVSALGFTFVGTCTYLFFHFRPQ